MYSNPSFDCVYAYDIMFSCMLGNIMQTTVEFYIDFWGKLDLKAKRVLFNLPFK